MTYFFFFTFLVNGEKYNHLYTILMGHAQLFLLPQVVRHREYSLSHIQISVIVKYFH